MPNWQLVGIIIAGVALAILLEQVICGLLLLTIAIIRAKPCHRHGPQSLMVDRVARPGRFRGWRRCASNLIAHGTYFQPQPAHEVQFARRLVRAPASLIQGSA
jgi:hypothetical protein